MNWTACYRSSLSRSPVYRRTRSVVVAVVIVRGGDVMGTHNIQKLTFNAYIHIYFDVY